MRERLQKEAAPGVRVPRLGEGNFWDIGVRRHLGRNFVYDDIVPFENNRIVLGGDRGEDGYVVN